MSVTLVLTLSFCLAYTATDLTERAIRNIGGKRWDATARRDRKTPAAHRGARPRVTLLLR